MKQDPQKIELIEHTDGTVWRNGYCDCGKLMYRHLYYVIVCDIDHELVYIKYTRY